MNKRHPNGSKYKHRTYLRLLGETLKDVEKRFWGYANQCLCQIKEPIDGLRCLHKDNAMRFRGNGMYTKCAIKNCPHVKAGKK